MYPWDGSSKGLLAGSESDVGVVLTGTTNFLWEGLMETLDRDGGQGSTTRRNHLVLYNFSSYKYMLTNKDFLIRNLS